ncbi:MAG: hypothetical protein AB4041_19735 [Microcystaceae cyanobacterium]
MNHKDNGLLQVPSNTEFKQDIEEIYQERLIKLIIFGSQAKTAWNYPKLFLETATKRLTDQETTQT